METITHPIKKETALDIFNCCFVDLEPSVFDPIQNDFQFKAHSEIVSCLKKQCYFNVADGRTYAGNPSIVLTRKDGGYSEGEFEIEIQLRKENITVEVLWTNGRSKRSFDHKQFKPEDLCINRAPFTSHLISTIFTLVKVTLSKDDAPMKEFSAQRELVESQLTN